jgi:uncharacterized protein YeaO (DUF488 family)
MPDLAPTQEILDSYKKEKGDWNQYEIDFNRLISARKIEKLVGKAMFKNRAVLLCSEAEPYNCHRRLVAEYLQKRWKNVKIIHL